MIGLLVIIKNFLGGGTAPPHSADPSPGGNSRTRAGKWLRKNLAFLGFLKNL